MMLYCNQSLRRRVTLTFGRSSSSSSAWNIPELHKDSIGVRTLIVSADDAQSQELTKRMWFENQKIGIESGFYTVKTAFATASSVQEGLEIVRRTGAKSIITIGSSSICDVGKGIQSLMEKGLKNLDELDRQIAIKNTLKDTSKIKSNSNSSTSTNTNSSSSTYGKTALGVSTSTVFPHFAIAAEICPSYLRSNWSALHKEDDVLVSRQCTPPQAVIYDNEILTESKEYSSIASRAHLLSNLFDILFSHFMSKRNVRENDFNSSSAENNTINIDRISNIIQMIDNTRDIRPNLRRLFPPAGVETVQGPNVLTLTAATTAIHALESLLKNSDESYTVNKLINQTDNLDIKTRIQSKKDNSDKDNSNKDESNGNDNVIIPLDDLHFGLINTVSLLCQLRSFQKGVPVPLSWVMTMVYKHCLDLTTTEKKANLNLSKLGAEEYPVVTSAIFSLEIMSKIFDKTEQEFLDSAKSDVKALAGSKIYIEKLKYKNTKIKKTGPGSGQGSEGMSPGGLIEGWVVSEEMNLEQLNKKQADSIVLKMLKSDFLLDLTENTIKHQK